MVMFKAILAAQKARKTLAQARAIHLLVYDHPSSRSRLSQPTECGRFMPPEQVTSELVKVTCVECRQRVEGGV